MAALKTPVVSLSCVAQLEGVPVGVLFNLLSPNDFDSVVVLPDGQVCRSEMRDGRWLPCEILPDPFRGAPARIQFDVRSGGDVVVVTINGSAVIERQKRRGARTGLFVAGGTGRFEDVDYEAADGAAAGKGGEAGR